MRVGFLTGGLVLQLVEPTGRSAAVEVSFTGAREVPPRGSSERPYRANYFVGSDPSSWRTGVRSFETVEYGDLYAGIDLAYRSTPEGWKYEFVVRPGADPRQIAWSYEGAAGVAVEESGGLSVQTAVGTLRDAPPYAYQEGDEIRCEFEERGDAVGFACDGWNPSRTLVIDPLVYSTFVGGASDAELSMVAIDVAKVEYWDRKAGRMQLL